jgi:NADPH-dependent glutamate synthase beta subunit-like oxidoreductase
VECGRHLNIETITWSDLEEVSGSAGNFKVKIRRRARFVDLSKCTGCGECATACPIAVANEFDGELGTRKGIFRPCPQAYPNAFVIDKRGKSPCRVGCPGGININAYVALTAAKRFDEALDSILESVPLAGVLGRVCDHPCETECHLGRIGDAVSIRNIKRFLADRRRALGNPAPPVKKREQNLAKIAVIGSGPAGLTAARELARKGYRPTIFEAMSRAGGMLAWGIPDYRLPPEILRDEIQDVLDEGVELILNTRLGTDVTLDELKKRGFEAFVIAIGAQAGTNLGIEGEGLEGVADAIAFLRNVKSNPKMPVGRKVVVIGGGNSAVDAARTARRLGAGEVTLVYRRTRAEMPAIPVEIEAAEHEGIRMHFLAAPVRVAGRNGRAASLECLRMKLGDPDESGRRKPVPIAGSEFTIETDMIVSAVGQKVVLPGEGGLKDLKQTRRGTLSANETDASTNL